DRGPYRAGGGRAVVGPADRAGSAPARGRDCRAVSAWSGEERWRLALGWLSVVQRRCCQLSHIRTRLRVWRALWAQEGDIGGSPGETVSDTGLSWSVRLAGVWGRAESTVTRIVLALVFALGLVAQFVKSVGDVLQGKVYLGGALLTVVGYVLYSEVQRLNAAHTAHQETEQSLAATVRRLEDELQRLNQVLRPLVTPAALQTEIRQALEAGGEVHVAAMSFTGETFVNPVRSMLYSLSTVPARRVHVRVLVPDFTAQIDVPGQVGAGGRICDAPEFREQHRRGVRGPLRQAGSAPRPGLCCSSRTGHGRG
ncbi:hypothetical protein ABZ848_48935, partial [Streptomyces sp. NPDC047081]